MKSNVLNIAHRGASGNAPENTMLAFWTAIQSNADMIELDVQITKDENLVIFHDKTLERITGDKQGIADFTLEELQKKDYGKWKHPTFEGTKIPTFQQVLTELPASTSYVLEIKPQNIALEDEFRLERLVIDHLDEYLQSNTFGQGYISVRHESSFEWLSNNCEHPIGLMQKKRTVDEFFELIKDYKIPFAQIRPKIFEINDYQTLKEIGAKIIVYYADNPVDWKFYLNQKVDGILTNYPALFSGYLKSLH